MTEKTEGSAQVMLSRAQSQVNMNSAESLLGQAFSAFFRELHEFALISPVFKDSITLE